MNLTMQKIKKMSKPFYNNSARDSMALIIPKAIMEVLELDNTSYIMWDFTMDDDGNVSISLTKI